MKKLAFVAAMAIAAATLTSCGNGTPRAQLRTEIDTLSYAIGITQSPIIGNIFAQQGIDSAYITAFIKGLNEGVNAGDNKKKAAYYAGLQLGQELSNQGVRYFNQRIFGEDTTQTVSLKNLLAGFVDGTKPEKAKMTAEEAQMTADRLQSIVRAAAMEKTYGPNRDAGVKYLAEMEKQSDVKRVDVKVKQLDGSEIESYFLYRVLKEGTGPIPADSQTVVVNYEGKLIDGTEFDSSYKRGQPATFPCKGVIKGWTEALVRMPVGSTWELFIPQELAYGDRNQGLIKPFSALTFKVELLEIKKK